MKTLLTTLLFFTSVQIYAQAPGFMGKKLSVLYDPHISFSIYDDFNTPGNDIPVLGMNLRNDFYIDYVISRGTTLGLTAKFLSAKMYDVKQVIDEGYIPGIDGEVGFNGDLKEKVTCIGITAKNFSYRKRGSIAPVGKYKSFELLVAFEKLKEKDLHDYNADKDILPFAKLIHFDDIPENHEIDIPPTAAFIFGFGRQSVYGKGVTMNYGWEIGLSLSQYLGNFVASRAHYYIENNSDEEYADAAGGRFAGALLLNFNIGIGYILL